MTTKHTVTITFDIDPSKFEVATNEAVNERLKNYFRFKLSELYSSGREWDEGIEFETLSSDFEKPWDPNSNVLPPLDLIEESNRKTELATLNKK